MKSGKELDEVNASMQETRKAGDTYKESLVNLRKENTDITKNLEQNQLQYHRESSDWSPLRILLRDTKDMETVSKGNGA